MTEHRIKPRRHLSSLLSAPGLCLAAMLLLTAQAVAQDSATEPLRVGIIGLDTSHAPAFAKELNRLQGEEYGGGFRVVAAYPQGSPDIESSVSRVPQYTEVLQQMDVEIVDSIQELLTKVDCVLLETNDGRPHLEQVIPVLQQGKPVFVDKPLAGSLEDCYAIYLLAEHFKTPLFSSSSLRFSSGVQAIRGGSIGKVLGCDAYSPASLEPTHPDLFWYGIHGCELLYTAMGTGCETVTRVKSPAADVVVGKWQDGRLGTFRGIRAGKAGYGGTAFGEQAIQSLGDYDGYGPLVSEIAKFFQSGQSPIPADETLELYSFMEAADESRRQGYVPVSLAAVRQRAQQAAQQRVAEILKSLEKQ